MMQINTVVFATAIVLSAGAASAQVRCTMPNGVVIEQRLATICPAGAVQGETLSGAPIAVQPLPTAPIPASAPTASETAAPQPKPPSQYDLAQVLCQSLLSNNIATSCEIESNIFSTSTIDATLPGGISTADLICTEIGGTFRKAKRSVNESSWELRSYTPHGSSNRPMARCQL